MLHRDISIIFIGSRYLQNLFLDTQEEDYSLRGRQPPT